MVGPRNRQSYSWSCSCSSVNSLEIRAATMKVSALETSLETIRFWRDPYRLEMSCQIIHDSIHDRPGWTREYVLALDGTAVGYGSVAVAGPWAGKPTVYEFYVLPTQRLRLFDLFHAL